MLDFAGAEKIDMGVFGVMETWATFQACRGLPLIVIKIARLAARQHIAKSNAARSTRQVRSHDTDDFLRAFLSCTSGRSRLELYVALPLIGGSDEVLVDACTVSAIMFLLEAECYWQSINHMTNIALSSREVPIKPHSTYLQRKKNTGAMIYMFS